MSIVVERAVTTMVTVGGTTITVLMTRVTVSYPFKMDVRFPVLSALQNGLYWAVQVQYVFTTPVASLSAQSKRSLSLGYNQFLDRFAPA